MTLPASSQTVTQAEETLAREQKVKVELAREVEELARATQSKDPVDVKWLRDYGLKGCPLEEEKAELLAKGLLEKLHGHGIFYIDQIQALAMVDQLKEVLECIGVANKITEAFDRLVAFNRRKSKLLSFLMSLSGNLVSMESMCANYGLAAALVLTMTFANYQSITTEDWLEYLRRIAIVDCDWLVYQCESWPTGLQQSPNLVFDYSRPLYCLGALNMLIDDPAANLTGTDQECCIGAVRCAAKRTYSIQLAFTLGNGIGTAVLLLVVLFTSWLFISLHATKANTSRYGEAKVLHVRLRQEFLALQGLFSFGIMLAFVGMGSVTVLKATTYEESWALRIAFILSFVVSTGFALKCLYEIFHINKAIDENRGDSTDLLQDITQHFGKMLSSEPDSPKAKPPVQDLAGETNKTKNASSC